MIALFADAICDRKGACEAISAIRKTNRHVGSIGQDGRSCSQSRVAVQCL